MEWRSPETDEVAHHLMVFWVLFRTSVLTLQVAEPCRDSLEEWTNSLGTATGLSEAPRPVPSQALP